MRPVISAAIIEILIYMGNILYSKKQGKAMNQLMNVVNQLNERQQEMYKSDLVQQEMYKSDLVQSIIILTRNTNSCTNTKFIDIQSLYNSEISELKQMKSELL